MVPVFQINFIFIFIYHTYGTQEEEEDIIFDLNYKFIFFIISIIYIIYIIIIISIIYLIILIYF